jgi:putative transposase
MLSLGDASSFDLQGERQRNVHARRRILDALRASRKWFLRIMRENRLLSAHPVRQRMARRREKKTTTLSPDVMWRTDGARVFTLNDGWVWIFSAVELWNAECVGSHACRIGSRVAAREPIPRGLEWIYDSAGKHVAQGLSLRMNHGSQWEYMLCQAA